MNWLTIAEKLVPIITNLIPLAEQLFSNEPKSGAKKKQLVTQAATDILKGGLAVTTGGAHNTWEGLDKIVPTLVDAAASVMYPPNK